MQSPTKISHFEILDGLRGIAAAVVLFAHSCAITVGTPVFEKKHLAVNFFFMLSGFVVACAYETRMREGLSIKEFYLRRIIRLYPLIVAGSLLGALYFATFEIKFATSQSKYFAVIASALAMPIVSAGFSFGLFPVNPPEWSLFFEIVAYFIFGITANRLPTWLLSLGAISSLLLAIFATHYYAGYSMPFWAGIFSAAASFTIGMLLWRIHERKLVRISPIPFTALAGAIVLACAIPASAGSMLDNVVAATVFPLVILSGAAHSRRKTQVLTALGDLSYPVYILHWPILLLAKKTMLPIVGPVATIIIGCFFAIVFAWVALKFFDIPVRRYLTKRTISPVVFMDAPAHVR